MRELCPTTSLRAVRKPMPMMAGIGVILKNQCGPTFVESVVPGSSADRCGVQHGDLLVEVCAFVRARPVHAVLFLCICPLRACSCGRSPLTDFRDGFQTCEHAPAGRWCCGGRHEPQRRGEAHLGDARQRRRCSASA